MPKKKKATKHVINVKVHSVGFIQILLMKLNLKSDLLPRLMYAYPKKKHFKPHPTNEKQYTFLRWPILVESF